MKGGIPDRARTLPDITGIIKSAPKPLIVLSVFGPSGELTMMRNLKRILSILIALLLFAFHVWPIVVVADDHKRREGHYERYESRKGHVYHNDRKGKQVKNRGEGNEVTGQAAAWCFVAANLTIVLSILMKGVSRYFPLEPETKEPIRKFNQLQKRYLFRFHYVLNPIALSIATFHLLLSTCPGSSSPEWGLIFVTIMVFLGVMVKFKMAPRWIRRILFRVHVSPAAFSVLILMLVVGHLFID